MKAWSVVMEPTFLAEFKRLLFSLPTPDLCGICFRRCVGTRPRIMLASPIEVNVCLICVPEVTVPGTHASPWTYHGADLGGVDRTVIQIVEERAGIPVRVGRVPDTEIIQEVADRAALRIERSYLNRIWGLIFK